MGDWENMSRDSSRGTTPAGSSVAPHLALLRRCGFCRLPAGAAGGAASPASPASLRRSLHTVYCFFALATTSSYVVQQAIYAYQVRGDMTKLSRVLFVMLCHMSCVIKQLVFHGHARAIDRIVADLDKAAFQPHGQRQARRLASAACGAARGLRAYYGCAVGTCVLWAAFPIIYHARGLPVEFPFWTFLDYNEPYMFLVVMTHSFYATNLVAIGNTTMDAFIATVLYQCQMQLRILRKNIEELPERVKLVALGKSRENYDMKLSQLFHLSIQHFQEIVELLERLQAVFGLAVLAQFAVGGWILCMAAYKIVSVNIFSFEFASTTLFIICILTELFLYCYYGNEVTVESSRVLDSLYSTQWVHASLSFKKSLILVMERAQRPLRPTAGFIVPLSLDTFVTIMKSSYSFYAVLRQTK